MDKILQVIESINSDIYGVVWGVFGLLLLIGTGIIITVLTKFFQISHIRMWFKHTLGSLFRRDVIKHSKEKGSISPFQALLFLQAHSFRLQEGAVFCPQDKRKAQ